MTGREVREWRGRRMLTQDEFAELMGVSRQCVQHWEYGDRTVPAAAETLMYLMDTMRGVKTAVQRVNKLREQKVLRETWDSQIRELDQAA